MTACALPRFMFTWVPSGNVRLTPESMSQDSDRGAGLSVAIGRNRLPESSDKGGIGSPMPSCRQSRRRFLASFTDSPLFSIHRFILPCLTLHLFRKEVRVAVGLWDSSFKNAFHTLSYRFAAIILVILYSRGKGKELKDAEQGCIADTLTMNLGINFFIIQIAVLIQFQLTNFLIMRYYGPSDVTEYNVAQKYFSMLFMVWNIIITPLWVATTDAFVREDFIWIRNALKKYLKLTLVFLSLGILMFFVSPLFFKLWLHDTVMVSKGLSFWLLVYYFVQIFASVFVIVLNGCGVLKTQTITSIISPFVFLLVFFLLKDYGVGFYSVLIASIVANFNGIVIAPIQCLQLFWKRMN